MLNRASYAVLCVAVLAVGQTKPNSVTVTTYSDETNANIKSISKVFSDGIGRKIRSLAVNGSGDIVSGRVFDVYGQPMQEAKPFYNYAYAHDWSNSPLISDANAYFNGVNPERPDAGGKAYTETGFYPDPLKRPREQAGPGAAFSVASGKTVRYWYFGRTVPAGQTYPDFIRDPTVSMLDAMIGTSSAMPTGAKFFLEITKDPDGRFSQILKDQFGRVVRTWTDPTNASGATHDEIMTENVYNWAGQLIKKYLPGSNGQIDLTRYSTFLYSSSGNLIKETHPDEGTIEYIYDRSGRLRFKRDANQKYASKGKTRFTYICYDAHSREIETGIAFETTYNAYFNQDYADVPSFPRLNPVEHLAKIRKYYDNTEGLPSALGMPSHKFEMLRNLNGRLVAVANFNEYGQDAMNQIVELYSYDDEGRVRNKKKFVPGLPEQESIYFYDLQDRVTYKSVNYYESSGDYHITSWGYFYDNLGRMVEIQRNYQTAITYSYTATGLLRDKLFQNLSGEFARQSYAYNIRDWIIDIEASKQGDPVYMEELFYESGGTLPQFGGNVGYGIERYWTGTANPSFFLDYRYDMTNRLKATYSSTPYNEGFVYDESGRFQTKIEGSNSYGPFEYNPGGNKVLKVGNHPTRNNSLGNFSYDSNGNMVFDRSKKMAVFYDWRNLPIKFRFFKTPPAPDYAVTWENVAYISAPIGAEVEMTYDAAGKRVLKKTMEY